MSFPSFAPWDITRSTFSDLLDCYPTALRESYKRKLQATAVRKHRKHPGRFDADDPAFDRQTEAYMKLDKWRYETLPPLVRERAAEEEGKTATQSHHLKSSEKYSGTFLHKDELVQLMEWKLKHGHFRPGLAGMIKTNKPEVVRKTTAAAFEAITDQQPSRSSLDDTFPKASLDILTGPLRAVGPATASLVLAVGTEGRAHEVPFYSDELFLWLCLDSFPGSEKNRDNYKKAERYIRTNGELNVKYNLREYRELYEEAVKLWEHLNGDLVGEKESRVFGAPDMERVAYVLQHLDVSGFPGAADILKQDEENRKAAKEKKEDEQEEDESAEEQILGVAPKTEKNKRKAETPAGGRNQKKKKKT